MKHLLLLILTLFSFTVKAQILDPIIDPLFYSFDIENIETSPFSATEINVGSDLKYVFFNYDENDSIKIEAIIIRNNQISPGVFTLNSATPNRVIEGMIRVKQTESTGTSFSFYREPGSSGVLNVDSLLLDRWFGRLNYEVISPITGDTIRFTGTLNGITK